jgi:AraC-like DNA-binding protein
VERPIDRKVATLLVPLGLAPGLRQAAGVATPLQPHAISRTGASTWLEHAPSADAAQVVDCTWTGIGGFDHSVMLAPDGCVDIVWDGVRLAAVPPRASGFRRRVCATSVNVGLRLACGWAGALLGPALRMSPGRDIDLGVLWEGFGAEAASRLRAAGPEAARAILEAVVEERLSDRPPPPAPVLEVISLLREDSRLRLDSLPRRLGTSSRTLRRQITRATGLAPKALQRVLRFQAMRLRLERGAGVQSSALLSADLGFADQAHMTRECRAMTGRTPSGLRRAQNGGRNLQDERPRV